MTGSSGIVIGVLTGACVGFVAGLAVGWRWAGRTYDDLRARYEALVEAVAHWSKTSVQELEDKIDAWMRGEDA